MSKERRRDVDVQLHVIPYLPDCPEKLVKIEKEEYRPEEDGDVIIDSYVLTRGNYCLDRRRVVYCNSTRSVQYCTKRYVFVFAELKGKTVLKTGHSVLQVHGKLFQQIDGCYCSY